MLRRFHILITHPSNNKDHVQRFFQRLLLRGHTRKKLIPLFQKALQNIHSPPNPESLYESRVYHHLQFYPRDPPSKIFQQYFYSHILFPKNEPPLFKLENDHAAPLDINRLIVAYHKPKNLRNLLFPRRLKEDQDFSVFALRDS